MATVNITQGAYESILIHMLYYGDKNLRKIQEVMGLLYGVRSGENISIQKAVPVKHGPDCEKVFTETDYITFNELDGKYTQEGLEAFGFYVSHPKVGFYLSQNEIKNLTYFIQHKKNPHAIVVVGDQFQLEQEGNLGIKVFNLKSPEKGANSDFQPIPCEVDAPKGMALFKTVKQLIENSQERKPLIEEQGAQLKADDSLWDGFGSGDSAEDKEKAKLVPMLNLLKTDVSNLDQSFLAAAMESYNEFLNQLADFIPKVMNDPSNDLINMRIAMEDGFVNLQTWFKQALIKQGQKIKEEFNRTLQMTQEGQDHAMKAVKVLLIHLRNEYRGK